MERASPSGSPQPARSWPNRAFICRDEPRLRAAWRLALHGLLYLILLGVLGIPTVLLTFVLDPQALTADGMGAMVQSLSLISSLAAMLLATWIARRLIDRRSLLSLGFHVDPHLAVDILAGFGISALMMGAIFALEWGVGAIRWQAWAWQTIPAGAVATGLLTAFFFFLGVAVQEETFSRGYQLQNLADGLGLRWALLVSSLIFAALHLGNPNATWYSVLPGLLAAGYFLAFGWVRTRQLWLPIGLHLGWNFFEGTVFGFPVSGLQVFQLIRQAAAGPTWFTGGAFGPEAGAVLLPGLALGTLLIWLYTRRRAPTAR